MKNDIRPTMVYEELAAAACLEKDTPGYLGEMAAHPNTKLAAGERCRIRKGHEKQTCDWQRNRLNDNESKTVASPSRCKLPEVHSEMLRIGHQSRAWLLDGASQ